MEKENGGIGIQLLRWFNPFYGRILQDKDWKHRKTNPPSVPSRNRKISKKGSKKRKGVTFDNPGDEDSDEEHKGKKLCQYHGTCGHTTD